MCPKIRCDGYCSNFFLGSERGLKFCGISVHILDMRYGRHGDLVALVQGKFPNAAVPWIIGSLQVGSTNMAILSFSWRRDSVTGERTCCIQSSRTVCALMMLPSCWKMPPVCIIASRVHFRKYTCSSIANLQNFRHTEIENYCQFHRHQNKRA